MKRTLAIAVIGLALFTEAAGADRSTLNALKAFDKDASGKIEGPEVEALRKEFAVATQGPIKALDRNKDGKLDDQEIARLNQRLAKTPERKAKPASTATASAAAAATASKSSASGRPSAPPSDGTPSDIAALSWQRPTRNADGTPLTNLAGYVIRYGKNPASLDRRLVVNDPKATSYVFKGLDDGTWYFAIAAVNGAGVESAPSGVISKRIIARAASP